VGVRRIVFVEMSASGVLGGSLTGIVPLLERLDRTRFAPSLVLFEPKPVAAALEAAGVPVHVLPPLPAQTAEARGGRVGRALVRTRDLAGAVLPRARAQAALFRRERPDLVYLANGLTACLDGVVAATLCGLPMICHEKGFRRVGPVERLLSRRVDACVCMTDEIAEHYRTAGVQARRFTTVWDGIDATSFALGGGDAVRRELGVPADAPVVGIVGHLQDWKGQLLVAEAVARARTRVPALRCLVVGGVHRQGTAYAEELRARIARPDLAGHVLLTGERTDVAACLDAMDVAIHASVRREPFGRVLIEAMAAGRPVIAPREGGPRVIVVDGETGVLVPPRDPAALADAIVALLADPERRAAMGAAGRARVAAAFDIRDHVRAIEALLDDVLDARRPAAAAAG